MGMKEKVIELIKKKREEIKEKKERIEQFPEETTLNKHLISLRKEKQKLDEEEEIEYLQKSNFERKKTKQASNIFGSVDKNNEMLTTFKQPIHKNRQINKKNKSDYFKTNMMGKSTMFGKINNIKKRCKK